MKIGILTFHYALNYGAVLQCWALKHYLENLGHDVLLIDRVPNQSNDFFSLIGRLKTKILPNSEVKSWLRFKKESKFMLGGKTKQFSNSPSMKNVLKYHFDVIVVGSDQVWRDIYTQSDDNYFLDFLPDNYGIKRISYAASFGTDTWEDTQERFFKIKKCLNQFDAISVRETSGIKICQKVFNLKAIQVLDPTALLNIDYYQSNLQLSNLQTKEDCIVSYFLGSDEIRETSFSFMYKWSARHGLQYLDLFRVNEETKKHYTVTEWLGQIIQAKYIVTNSFHATVFAILAHKQFVVIDLASGGSSRIHSLVSMFGMEYRLINRLEDTDCVLSISVDWESIDAVLQEKRKESISFLKLSGL